MSYIAVDSDGNEYIFPSKPTRYFGKTYNWWTCPGNQKAIHVPIGTAKALFDAGLLQNYNVILNRNMNWGDNPIELKN